MSTLKRLFPCCLFVFVLFGAALAQENRPPIEKPREPVGPLPAAPLVTAAASAERVRFVSPGTVIQLRLEVYNEAGQKLFDTELRGGNVLDWHLQDGAGARLAAGSYACVLTTKSLSGRLSQRVGLVTVNDEKAVIEAAGAAQLSTAQQQTIGPVEGNAAFTVLQQSEAEAITAVTHDGTDGQITRTRGALSFRLGDFFSGKDKEQMRLTEDGRLGIGTDKPEATLDVAGDISARGTVRADKVEFADGTVQTSGLSWRKDKDGKLMPNVGGTGTQNRLAKWTDNAGTLGDSLLGETGGGVELRPAAPGVGVNPTLTNFANVAGFAQVSFYPAAGTNTNMSFSVVPRGTGAASNRAQFAIFNTDLGANPTNYEFASLRARGSDFVMGTGKSGTGVNRPLMFASGFLSDNTTNNGQFYLASNGNVGVGTVSPAQKLDVAGNINASGSLTGATGSVMGNLTVDTNTLHVDAAGNRVGIGTIAPTSVLHVTSAQPPPVSSGSGTNATEVLRVVGAKGGNAGVGGGPTAIGGNGAGVVIQAGDGGDGIDAGQGGSITLQPGLMGSGGFPSVDGAVLLAPTGGNVGIGTTAPNAPLDVVGAINSSTQYNIQGGRVLMSNAGNRNLFAGHHAGELNTGIFNSFFGHNAGAENTGSFNTFIGANSDGTPVITNATAIGANAIVAQSDSLVLGNGVNVGIGTNSPLGRLQVVTATDTDPLSVTAWDSRHFVIGGSASSGGIGLSYDQTNNVGYISSLSPNVLWRNLVLQAGGGNVGIGTTSPAHKLHVNGTVAGVGPYVDASDLRYKRDIRPIGGALSKVLSLRGVTFDWRREEFPALDFAAGRSVGFVAQEVERVVPEAVTRDAAGFRSVAYSHLTPVLVEAVKEQQDQITAQQQTIAELRRRNAALEARLGVQNALLEARLDALERAASNNARRARRPRR